MYKGYLSMIDLEQASPGSTYVPKKGRGNKVINSALIHGLWERKGWVIPDSWKGEAA